MRSSRSWLVLPAYILLSVILTLPIAGRFTRSIPSSRGPFDPVMQAFLLGWDAQAMRTDPAHVFDAPIFHPEPRTVAYMDHMLGETALAEPALLAGSVAAGYNFVFLLSFVASAWATYRLSRYVGASRPGAFLAGLLFAFAPYRFGNMDLLNQLQTQFLPIGLWFGLRYIDRGRSRDAWGVGGSLAAQAYFGWYYTFYLAIAIGTTALVWVLGRRRISWRWETVAPITALLVLVVTPVAAPYLQVHRALPEFHRTLGESALYSADVTDYVKVNASGVVAGRLGLPRGVQPYFPGLVAVALGVVGAVWAWRRAVYPGLAMLAVTVSGFILSLGPILHVAGARIWIPLPYAALYYLFPGFASMRAPARFAVFVALGSSVLAGLGVRALEERWRARSAFRRGVMTATFVVALLGAWPRPLSMVDLPSPRRLPPAYAYLATRSTQEPLLELPVPVGNDEDELDSIRQFYILLHGHPRLDGTSGFLSRRYRTFRSAIQRFPEAEAMRAADDFGAKLILVHYGDYDAGTRSSLRGAIQREPRLRAVLDAGDDVVYELRSSS